VVALVDRCEQQSLVVRRQGREDRRQIEVHLLEEGMSRVTQIAEAHQPELRYLQENTPLAGWNKSP
tara:strand:- start:2102 stop:2299 length:198 start_codon:yes stop_codon:yes gene_type:complete